MILFKRQPRFSETTGKPVADAWEEEEYFCDYTGRLVENPTTVFDIKDWSGCEEWWYYTEFFIKGKRVEPHSLVATPFLYVNSSIEALMALEFAATYFTDAVASNVLDRLEKNRVEMGFEKIKHKEVESLSDFMLQCRLRVIRKLLKSGITSEELRLEFDCD